MKERSDFVSNSSSSSFMILKQKNLEEFLVKYAKLFADLHNLILRFTSKENYDKACEILKSTNDDSDTKYVDFQEGKVDGEYEVERNHSITFRDCKIILNRQLQFIECYKLSSALELYLNDSWGDYNFRLHQILTLLEDKGFDFQELFSDEGWVKMSEELRENEIPL